MVSQLRLSVDFVSCMQAPSFNRVGIAPRFLPRVFCPAFSAARFLLLVFRPAFSAARGPMGTRLNDKNSCVRASLCVVLNYSGYVVPILAMVENCYLGGLRWFNVCLSGQFVGW